MPAPLLSRDQLLQRLCQAFRRYGYEGTSLSTIASVTGLGKASLYHHFPEGKVQMAGDVLDWIKGWFEENVFHPLESAQPPRQRICHMLDILSTHYENGQLADTNGFFSLGQERDLFSNKICFFYDRWIAALQMALTDAGLSRDTAEKRAHEAVERIMGAIVLSRSQSNKKNFMAITADLPDQILAGSTRSTLWTNRSASIPLSVLQSNR